MLKRKTKYFFVVLFLLGSFTIQAQEFLSPFSKFGLGELMPSSFISERAMGDVSVALGDEEQFSATNPASYGELTSLTFETGLSAHFYQIQSASDNYSNKDYRLPYFAFALPLSKKRHWGFSFGLRQYSKVGYQFEQSYSTPISYNEIYQGTGGYSKFYLGTSIQVVKNLFVGANVGYFFGTQQVNQRMDFDSITPVSNHRDVYSSIGNLVFDVGMIYKIHLNEKSKSVLSFAATSSFGANMNAKQDLYDNTFVTVDGTNYISDSILKKLQIAGKVMIPTNLGFGIQFKNTKWVLSADMHYQKWSQFRFFERNDSLNDMTSIGIGLQWKPGGDDDFQSYFERVRYRIGARYARTYFNLNENQPTDMRFTFGLGLPTGTTGSSINLTFEVGHIGDINSNAIRQRYFITSFGFHLFDNGWFNKRMIE